MSNHADLIAIARERFELLNLIRDLKKYTSKIYFKLKCDVYDSEIVAKNITNNYFAF